MKFYIFIALTGIFLLTTACPGSTFDTDLKKLQKNGMDFPDLRRVYYNGINFKLSDMFVNDYENNYTLTENADTKVIYALDLNFSVESFTEEDAEVYRYAFDEDIESLDAVHDNYIIQRKKSLYDNATSIKKELPKSVKYPGYIQVVHGGSFSTEAESSYFTATLDINGQYYVFQMIGKRENMGYLYDDFIDILSSVEK